MAQSDATAFLQSLKLWDRPEAESCTERSAVFELDDNIDQLVDEMFERFCEMNMAQSHAQVGNC